MNRFVKRLLDSDLGVRHSGLGLNLVGGDSMTEAHIDILRKGIVVWNRWREENPATTPDLSGEVVDFLDGYTHDFFEHHEGLNLTYTILTNTVFEGAWLVHADFAGSILMGTRFTGGCLDGAQFVEIQNLCDCVFSKGADLSNVVFDAKQIYETEFDRVVLHDANFQGVHRMEGVVFRESKLRDIAWNRNTECMGVQCEGGVIDPAFRQHLKHAEVEHALKYGTRGGRVLYWFWKLFMDCGRTPWRWSLWALGFVFLFWVVFVLIEYLNGPSEDAFMFGEHVVSDGRWVGLLLYFSATIFSTLGFEDIKPVSNWAMTLVVVEVVLGYMMLGALVSIVSAMLMRRD